MAGFGLAYAVGLVVPGAPGGLGVFEATLLLRLSGSVAEAPLLAVVLSYRLVATRNAPVWPRCQASWELV